MQFRVSVFFISLMFAIVPMVPIFASQAHMSECEESACTQMSAHDCVSMCVREVKNSAAVSVFSSSDGSADAPLLFAVTVLSQDSPVLLHTYSRVRSDVDLSVLQQRRD